jgi:hypothetical protein
MYNPPAFREDDPETLAAIMAAARLCTLVSNGPEDVPLISHLPLQFSDSRRIAAGLLSLMQNNRTPAWLAGRPARLSALSRDDVARAAQAFGQTPLSIMVAGQPVGL